MEVVASVVVGLWLLAASLTAAHKSTNWPLAFVTLAMEACKDVARKTTNDPAGEWIEILPETALKPGYEESRYHTFEIAEDAKAIWRNWVA